MSSEELRMQIGGNAGVLSNAASGFPSHQSTSGSFAQEGRRGTQTAQSHRTLSFLLKLSQLGSLSLQSAEHPYLS